MAGGYEVYCLVDPLFYDTPTRRLTHDRGFAEASAEVPPGWQRRELDDWLLLVPDGVKSPTQGWKIHASACLDNAAEVVSQVWDYCIAHRVPFKFISGRELFFIRNLKYAHRGSSGKLVTIYPTDERQLETILNELGERLEGQSGPYILSDLRWGGGPLYVRYGGFAERWCIGPGGVQELAILDGDGQLVPDRRGPTFQVPPWVTMPACLEPHLQARNAVKVDELPCTIESALHFSNSGGVYLGTDHATGERVVLKEARPHAGLAVDGSDAVARLQRERDNLARLAGLESVPTLRGYQVVGEHHFLIQDYVEGKSLHSRLAQRSPLVLRDMNDQAATAYAEWAMDACRRVEEAVDAVHQRGLAILDLHPSNVLVGDDGRVTLIDLEMAADASGGSRQTLADPAFLAPVGATGFDVDRYALGCMRLYVFIPLTSLFSLDPEKPEQLAAEMGEVFPSAREFLAEAAAMVGSARPLEPAPGGNGSAPQANGSDPGANGSAPGSAQRAQREIEPDPTGWSRARHSMAAAILASATPDRADRLFPGDIEQFVSGGLNLAHGAAGVLYALQMTGAGQYPEHEEWLERHALEPESGTRLGFYDGLHGVAYVLERLGRHETAKTVLDRCCEELDGKYDQFGLDLRSGLAGIGLNLIDFAARRDDPALWDLARYVVQVAAERIGDEDAVGEISGGRLPYAGLIRGSSGPAVLFMRMFDRTGDSSLLDLAATAIRQDLKRCIIRPEDGALEVNEGWRSCPYVADGGVGIAFALQDYLTRRHDDEFADALGATRKAAEAQLYIESGLFYGRAGMLLFLSREYPPGQAGNDPLVAAQVRRLAWHALSFKGNLAFPGDRLVRLSMDLTTGTAGVLLAVGAALHPEPVHLPFLERPAPRAGLEPELLLTANEERR